MRRRAKEKKERALNEKLFLKPERCSSHKCVMVRRPFPPGQHGQKRRRRPSEYARQLKEKQKIAIVYGLTNKQMANLFKEHAGDPKKIVSILEKRLDTVVFHLAFSPSQRMARQAVNHGHIMVNGRKVDIPSYQVEEGDTITIRPQSRDIGLFDDLDIRLKKHEPPEWLKLNKDKFEGKCVGQPSEDAILPFDINLVGEFYSR
ncbi:MAG TPA: 30S ribosomal protein S4 [Candidatus Paceibacterota bacterium]|nr:30S ribosomal protein S4 [Candidatus Paceibacterota bacterium]